MTRFKIRKILLISMVALMTTVVVGSVALTTMNGINQTIITVTICSSAVIGMLMAIVVILTDCEKYPEKIHWVFRWFPRRTFIRISEITMLERLTLKQLSEQVERWRREAAIEVKTKPGPIDSA